MNPRDARRILEAAGPTMSIPDAATVLGISRAHCYDLARQGELPVRVLRLGSKIVVLTVELRRVVGLDDQPQGDLREGTSPRSRSRGGVTPSGSAA